MARPRLLVAAAAKRLLQREVSWTRQLGDGRQAGAGLRLWDATLPSLECSCESSEARTTSPRSWDARSPARADACADPSLAPSRVLPGGRGDPSGREISSGHGAIGGTEREFLTSLPETRNPGIPQTSLSSTTHPVLHASWSSARPTDTIKWAPRQVSSSPAPERECQDLIALRSLAVAARHGLYPISRWSMVLLSQQDSTLLCRGQQHSTPLGSFSTESGAAFSPQDSPLTAPFVTWSRPKYGQPWPQIVHTSNNTKGHLGSKCFGQQFSTSAPPPGPLLRLNDLQPASGSRRVAKRLGRGMGSGKGKTAGRGHKGQKSRSGRKPKIGFEGGQTPLRLRLPKRGFHNPFSMKFQVVNVEDVVKKVEQGAIDPSFLITMKTLKDAGLGGKAMKDGVKLLARGSDRLAVPLHFEVSRASSTAREAVAAAGGSVTRVHYNALSLRALLKPEWFAKKGRLLPRPARPPPRIRELGLVDAVGRLPAPKERVL